MIKKKLSCFVLLIIILFQYSCAVAQVIEDGVALQAFKGQNLSRPACKKQVIEDESIQDLKDKKFVKAVFNKDIIVENDYIKEQEIVRYKPSYKLIDENAEIVRIFVSAVNLITTKDGLKLGQKVNFKVSKDIYKNEVIFIKKDTSVEAFIELISAAGRCGDPDEIEIGRFSTKDINGNIINLTGTIRKQGADRGIWVRPLYNTGYGAIFYFVKGGKTRIKPEQNFELYYE